MSPSKTEAGGLCDRMLEAGGIASVRATAATARDVRRAITRCALAVRRLVATDVDGTLLRSDGSVSDRTRQTRRRVREAGVRVGGAGRNDRAPFRAERLVYDRRDVLNVIE